MKRELAEAIALVKQEHPDAMNNALALLHATVMNFSLRVCQHRENAEDTAQEVLLRTARFLPGFESPDALSVWLYKVARSQCLTLRRHGMCAPARKLSLDDDRAFPMESTGPSPEAFLMQVENAERLLAAVKALPEGHCHVLTLHSFGEYGTAEIARALGVSQGAVRVRLHRARTALREKLQRRDGLASVSP